MRLRDGNTGPTGAPQNVDEAWAIYMGTPQGTGFPSSLSATAVSREMNFKREGTVDRPLREALQRAQQAAAAGQHGRLSGCQTRCRVAPQRALLPGDARAT